ncbi:MAG: EAL domain-containing protein [Acidobacteriota bacterium]|nr:EAL domain-containing protein [Acidobacteriota bacterium]
MPETLAGAQLEADAGVDPDHIRVLLVEDDEVDQMAFERIVRREGLPYRYEIVGSLGEARELFRSHRFDVVISDYHLPDGTALELFDRPLSMPIIVITGAGGEEIAVQAMKAGAYDYLIKDLERKYLKILPITVENALKKSRAERELRMLSHAITKINEAIFITDPEGEVLYVNEAFCRTYGYLDQGILGRHRKMLWADEGQAPGDREVDLDGSRGGEQVECLHRRRDGTTFPVLLSRSTLELSREEGLAEVGVVWDITQRKRSENALRESEERYALAARGANDGLWDWDLRIGEIFFSARWKHMMGYSEQEIGSSPEDWFRLVHPEDLSLLKAHIEAHMEGRTPHFEHEHRIRHRNGDYRWMLSRGLAVRGRNGQAYRMAGSQTDVTERKRAEQQLVHDALHDALTGLPNRALFLDRLNHALNRSRRRDSYHFAVLFLDLDRFKVVNDSLGHMLGDELLTAIARRLEACLRMGDTVARLGGDEFAILLDDLDRTEDAVEVSLRILEDLQAPFHLDGHELFATASIGIALSVTGYERAEEVLRDADTAMYRAKSQAEKRPVVFDPTMHANAMTVLRLETDLRRAVEREEFELFYQPIVSLKSGVLWGFEALVRWRHPERGLVYPSEFLPLAEETGLILSIGYWVLREAARQTRDWQQRFPRRRELGVSVNVAGQQLAHGAFVAQVDEVLRETSIPPESLRLEITEGVLMDSPEATALVLEQLRERQIKLHIDDFGTGYSSLSHLHRFPVDTLKIDRSFIGALDARGENSEIVRTIIALAHSLNMDVLAEGVETRQQLIVLKGLGCEFGQGFFFARPLEKSAAEEWVARPVHF